MSDWIVVCFRPGVALVLCHMAECKVRARRVVADCRRLLIGWLVVCSRPSVALVLSHMADCKVRRQEFSLLFADIFCLLVAY